MFNKAILVGHTGRDPETRKLPNGDTVANFSLATSRSWKDAKTGERKEHTDWHRCTAYGKLADVIAEHVKKGQLLTVEGRIEYGEYEKDGVKRYTTDIIVDEMRMLGPKREAEGGERQPETAGAGAGGDPFGS